MGAVLALSWFDDRSDVSPGRIKAAALDAGFRTLWDLPSGWLGVCGPRPPKLHDLQGGLIVLGDLFETSDGERIGVGGRLARLRQVTRARWGRYLAIDRDPDGRLRAVMRDPSGAMEVAVWNSSGVSVVSTQTPDWLMAAAPAPVSLDWEGVPALLVDSLAGLTQPPLRGLVVLDAGESVDLDTGERAQMWRPVSEGDADIWDPAVAREGFVARVDDCVGSLAALVGCPGAELSGGLDSAIVAGALGGGRERVRVWLNAYSVRPETDERRYAEAVATHLGFGLTCLQRVEQALEYDILAQTSGDVRPGYNGADPVFDALVAQACAAHGVDGLLTGKGGDALFYQGGSSAVFADLLRARGPAALAGPVALRVARWTRRSVWSVIRDALAAPQTSPPPASLLMADRGPARRSGSHPWLAGGEGLGPAKRLQLHALTSNLAYATACRRTVAVDLIHPLMAQPLLEWSMRIPAPVLTAGRTDRFLARSAFSDRLPATVVWRR